MFLGYFMVALYYITVRQYIAQPSEASDNDLGRSLPLHPPLKPSTYFKPVFFNKKIRHS